MKKKNTYSYLVTICVILILLAVTCAGCSSATELTTLDAPPEAATLLTDDGESTELLLDERQWNFPNLAQHQVYLLDDCLYIDFLFDKKADADQLDRARSFALTSFTLLKYQFLGPYPYREVIKARQNEELMWNNVSCRVWQGDELLYQDDYDHVYYDED